MTGLGGLTVAVVSHSLHKLCETISPLPPVTLTSTFIRGRSDRSGPQSLYVTGTTLMLDGGRTYLR